MKRKESFWGLLFILAAVLIIVNQFGLFEEISMFKIVIAVILAGVTIKSILHINFWGILFPLAFICILFADEWNITEFTPWPALLTAFLCSLGLSMIFQRPHHWIHHTHAHGNSFGSHVIRDQDSNIIDCETSFGECMKYVNSENFERANIKCSFGSIKVFFDNASIPSGKADIFLDVAFGDAQLYLPKSWKVVSNVKVFLGDMDEKNRNDGADIPVVTIHGNVSFGDAKVFYI